MWSEDGADRPAGVRGRIAAYGANPPGVLLIALATVMLLAALTVLNWFRDGSGFFAGANSFSRFPDIGTLLDAVRTQVESNAATRGNVSFGIAGPYFGWLGWVLFLAALATAALAVSQYGARHWTLRWLGAVVAFTGGSFTVFALNLITFAGKNLPADVALPTFGDFVRQSSLGAWFAVIAYVLFLVGSLLPHRG